MLSLACIFQAGFVSSWGNYIVPDFFQQDIRVDYLAAARMAVQLLPCSVCPSLPPAPQSQMQTILGGRRACQ